MLYSEPEPGIALVTNQNYADHPPGPRDTQRVIEVADTSIAYDLDIKYLHTHVLKGKKIHAFLQPRELNTMLSYTKLDNVAEL